MIGIGRKHLAPMLGALRGGDRHSTASGRRRTDRRAAATTAWAVLRAGGHLAIQVRIARQRSAQRRCLGNRQPVLSRYARRGTAGDAVWCIVRQARWAW